ncbi:helix-turn-helix transcriptional regulator [Streptomyces fructofermentans]|uniref:helix-turn-helix transcriptional regulator n=1 Tax=Streptomyces fructofermentans TaxID=152141 RepID=UPI0037B8FF86
MTIEADLLPLSDKGVGPPRILDSPPPGALGRLFDEPRPYSVTEIFGDRWTGKSGLLSELSTEAADRGWRIASGRAATRSLSDVSFGVFVDALDDLMAHHGAEASHGGPDDQRKWLAGVFPSMAAGAPPRPVENPFDRYQAFRATRTVLERLGSAGGLLLTLDDIHWADESSLRLLSYLLRHPPRGAVMIALTHRPRQVDLALRSLLNQAVVDGRAYRLSPARLSEERARALLPDDISPGQVELMLSESGRNPGLLRALASTRSVLGGAASTPAALPLDVLTESLRDFRTLSEQGWRVARAAAVLQEPFSPDALRVVSQVTDDQLRTAIDELIREDLLDPDSHSSRLRFVNPLLRATAYQSAGQGWLLGAHARAAGLLSGRGADPVQLAGHLERSGLAGDNDSARVLLEAAAAHLWNDPERAASWARAALDTGEPDRDGGRARLLLGRALALCGRLEDASVVLGALRAAPGTLSEVRADAARARASALRFLGRRDAAERELAAAREHAVPERAAEHALLLGARLENALDSAGSLADGEVTGLLASVDALPAGARGGTLAMIATAAVRAGAAEHAELHTVAAARLFDRLSDDEVVPHLDGLFRLAEAEAALGRVGAARAHGGRGLRLAECRRLRVHVVRFALAVSRLERRGGDVPGAVRHAACAEAAAATTDSAPLLAESRALRAELEGPAGGPAVPGQVTRGPADGTVPAPQGPAPDELGLLSKRELEIAVLVSSGRTNQQIARTLAISHKTVETHLGRIFKKLTVSSRAEVAAMVGRFDRSGPS